MAQKKRDFENIYSADAIILHTCGNSKYKNGFGVSKLVNCPNLPPAANGAIRPGNENKYFPLRWELFLNISCPEQVDNTREKLIKKK